MSRRVASRSSRSRLGSGEEELTTSAQSSASKIVVRARKRHARARQLARFLAEHGDGATDLRVHAVGPGGCGIVGGGVGSGCGSGTGIGDGDGGEGGSGRGG